MFLKIQEVVIKLQHNLIFVIDIGRLATGA